MKTPYVSELEPNQLILGVFLVQHKEIRQKKTGEPYLSLTLADRTGDLDAKMWDNVPEVMDTFERDCFLKVKGMVQLFQNKPQLTIYRLQRLAETEIDIADFLPASKRDRDEMFAELKGWIASMTNPHLKALLETIFADEAVALAYRTAPAAKSIHHGWIGGLIEHVLSVCQLAKVTAAHYPDIDFDLLLTGVILHDIGKIHELTYARSLGYSTRRPVDRPHLDRRPHGGGRAAQASRVPAAAARPGGAHDPEPPRIAGIRLAQSAHVPGGDAAASDRQPGFEDGSDARAHREGSAGYRRVDRVQSGARTHCLKEAAVFSGAAGTGRCGVRGSSAHRRRVGCERHAGAVIRSRLRLSRRSFRER